MLAKNLMYLRTQRKKSQNEIAAHLGITRQAYTNYENNKRKPDYNILIKLSRFFNISVDNLINTDLSESNIITKQCFTSEELWEIICKTAKDGFCNNDEYDGFLQLAQNIFDFNVEKRLISEKIISSDIQYRHYSADDL